MDAAMVITWNGSVPGRERQSMLSGVENRAYLDQMVAEGRCASHQWFFGQDGTGMVLITGDQDSLYELYKDDAFQDMWARSRVLLRDCRWQWMTAGDGMDRWLTRWVAAAEALGHFS